MGEGEGVRVGNGWKRRRGDRGTGVGEGESVKSQSLFCTLYICRNPNLKPNP